MYYNLWHTITEANGCNAKESKSHIIAEHQRYKKQTKQTKEKKLKYNTKTS